MFVTVVVECDDATDAITRITGPGGDEWRSHLYPLHDTDDVIEHLAYNRVANGVSDARRLDGWADLPDDALVMGRPQVELDEVIVLEPPLAPTDTSKED